MNDSGYEVLNVSIIETKLLGPKNDQWAVISLASQWLATTRAVYAEAVKAAIADAISQKSNPSD